MIWSMEPSSQAAFLRLPRRLVWVLRSRATKLRAILRRRAKLRAARPVAHAAVILTEGDVQHPMQRVLNTPVPADCSDQDGRSVAAACQEVADLGLGPAGAVDAPDRSRRPEPPSEPV